MVKHVLPEELEEIRREYEKNPEIAWQDPSTRETMKLGFSQFLQVLELVETRESNKIKRQLRNVGIGLIVMGFVALVLYVKTVKI